MIDMFTLALSHALLALAAWRLLQSPALDVDAPPAQAQDDGDGDQTGGNTGEKSGGKSGNGAPRLRPTPGLTTIRRA